MAGECLHVTVHDPTMALYRLQEHVRKSAPTVIDRKGDMLHTHAALQGGCFDMDNAISVVSGMTNASAPFSRVHDQLRTAMYYKQQLDYERMRRERDRPPGAGLRPGDSNDLLWQELRKSKSLGQLKRSASGNGTMGAESSIYSRSNASTPLSEMPRYATETSDSNESSPRHDHTLRAPANDDRSSTATSGADSPQPVSDVDNVPIKTQTND